MLVSRGLAIAALDWAYCLWASFDGFERSGQSFGQRVSFFLSVKLLKKLPITTIICVSIYSLHRNYCNQILNIYAIDSLLLFDLELRPNEV